MLGSKPMEVDDIFGYDWAAHASRVWSSKPCRTIPTYLTTANVRLLCAKCNLQKSDKILAIALWILAGAAAAPQIEKLSS